MPVFIWENKNLNGFYLSLCVKYGSLHTKFKYNNKTYQVPDGIAHYMEHIKFNESNGVRANDFFDKLGSDINAFTTFEYTNYEVTGHNNYKDNLSHLITYVLTPYFTKEIISKERGIITEEIKMDHDDPYSKLFYKSLKNVFHKSHYRNLVSGEVADIKKIKLDDINTIFSAFYHPENMFLVVCGNIDKNKTMNIVNDTLLKIKIDKYIKPTILKEKEPVRVLKKEDIYKDNVMIPKAKISLKIPLNKFKEIPHDKLCIYLKLILDSNFGNTSDFKEELIENNLVSSFYASRSLLDDFLIVNFTYESEAYDIVKKKILDKIKKLEISPSYLKRMVKCSISNMILSFDNKEAVSSMIQSDIIDYNKIIDDCINTYKNVNQSELNIIAKKLDTANISTTVVIPK
jgi:predicted Zn-dependent peptidase